MNEDATDRDRIAELEAEVESLREQVTRQYEVLSLLAGQADSDAIPDLDCPYCGEGTIRSENGITWQQLSCTACDFAEYM